MGIAHLKNPFANPCVSTPSPLPPLAPSPSAPNYLGGTHTLSQPNPPPPTATPYPLPSTATPPPPPLRLPRSPAPPPDLCTRTPPRPHGATHRTSAQVFDGALEGHIVFPVRGDEAYGWNRCFAPDGYGQTLGEMAASGFAVLPSNKALLELCAHLRSSAYGCLAENRGIFEVHITVTTPTEEQVRGACAGACGGCSPQPSWHRWGPVDGSRAGRPGRLGAGGWRGAGAWKPSVWIGHPPGAPHHTHFVARRRAWD